MNFRNLKALNLLIVDRAGEIFTPLQAISTQLFSSGKIVIKSFSSAFVGTDDFLMRKIKFPIFFAGLLNKSTP